MLLLSLGLRRTALIVHGRDPLFDFNIYYAQARQLGRADFVLAERWFYPPFALIVFWPLSLLPLGLASGLWLALQGCLVLWLALSSARVLAELPRLPRYAATFGLTAASLPLVHCVRSGQISLLLLVVSAVGLARPGRLGPPALAAAAATKLYPAFFVLPHCVRLRPAYLRRFALWLVGLGALLPFALLPAGALRAVWHRTLAVVLQEQRPLFDEAQSLRALVERLWRSRSIFDEVARPLLFELPYSVVAVLLLLATLGILGMTVHRLRLLEPAHPISVAMTMISFTLLMDPGWSHYYVVLGYAQPVLLANARARSLPLALCAASFALSSLSLVAGLLRPELVPRIFELSTTTGSGLLVLAGLWWVAARQDPHS